MTANPIYFFAGSLNFITYIFVKTLQRQYSALNHFLSFFGLVICAR